MSTFVAAGTKPVVQSADAVVPPVPAVEPPEKTFLTCQVESAFGPVRHPLDPVGASPSTLLRLVYLLLLIAVVGSMVVVAGRLAAAPPAAKHTPTA